MANAIDIDNKSAAFATLKRTNKKSALRPFKVRRKWHAQQFEDCHARPYTVQVLIADYRGILVEFVMESRRVWANVYVEGEILQTYSPCRASDHSTVQAAMQDLFRTLDPEFESRRDELKAAA